MYTSYGARDVPVLFASFTALNNHIESPSLSYSST